MPSKWSKKIVVRHILERHRNGQKLSSGYMQTEAESRPLFMAGSNYFGSWRKAIEAAGLNYDDVRVKQRARPKWSKDKIVSTIRRMHRLKQPLNSNHIQKKEIPLYGAALKYFGGWSQAIAAAGLDYSKLRKKAPMRSWSKSMIAEEIVRRVKKGLSIGGGDVTVEDRTLYHAAQRHFGKGAWAKARVLAGFAPIDPRPWTIWNKQIVCDELVRLYESGVALNAGSLQNSPYDYIRGATRKVFGTYAKAVKAAGLDYSKIRQSRQQGWWTKTRILMCIKNLEGRGIRLSSKAINLNHGALFSAAVIRFGSWSQAVEAAGINYRKHCRIWSTKAWLRRMSDAEYKDKVR